MIHLTVQTAAKTDTQQTATVIISHLCLAGRNNYQTRLDIDRVLRYVHVRMYLPKHLRFWNMRLIYVCGMLIFEPSSINL